MTTPLFKNILAQPDALRAVLGRQQSAEGKAALLQAAALFRESKRIVLTGMGASLFACGPLRYLLARSGATVSSVETAELLYFLDHNLDGETSVLLVSRSGESVEVIKLLDLLQQRGCKTIGVANVAGSTLPSRTDASILLGSPADQLVAIQTYVATVAVLLLLGVAYDNRLEEAFSELADAINLLESFVPACVDASQKWEAFVGNSPLYFLGRGPSLATVEEGVLLMHETAKSPAVGMSIAQFRHGPVEVAGESVRAVVIGTQSATADHDLQLAIDLTRMGVDVRWIGPLPPNTGIEPFARWPDHVPSLLKPVFEIIPLQLLAYRTAEMRGITPGDFRWAPAITSSESGFPGLNEEEIR